MLRRIINLMAERIDERKGKPESPLRNANECA
jgi:hypothetical protein